MKRSNSNSRMPQHDYGLALRNAVSWLGERHLLAEPVMRRIAVSKPFYVEAPSWHGRRHDLTLVVARNR